MLREREFRGQFLIHVYAQARQVVRPQIAVPEFRTAGENVLRCLLEDVPFLNAELAWCNHPQIPMERAIDTLDIARKKFPGSPASLDALCRRFGIDNSHRTLHGALLDSEILAEVYLELIGGRQPGLVFSQARTKSTSGLKDTGDWRPRPRPQPLPSRLTHEEAAAHEAFIEAMGDGALWKKIEA